MARLAPLLPTLHCLLYSTMLKAAARLPRLLSCSPACTCARRVYSTAPDEPCVLSSVLFRSLRQLTFHRCRAPTSSTEEAKAATEDTAPHATPSNYIFTRPQDAYDHTTSDPLFASLSSSTTTSTPPSRRPPVAPPSLLLPARPHLPPRQRQAQNLSRSEAQAFADLLAEILPDATESSSRRGGGGGIFDQLIPGVEKVQQAVRRKSGQQREKNKSHQQLELSEAEETRLDEMKEEMRGCRSDVELIRWALPAVFGLEAKHGLFPSLSSASSTATFELPSPTPTGDVLPTGPLSSLYPHLLHTLFLTLRDTYNSPHSALHIFQLASTLSPTSYIRGCTTALYDAMLSTRWWSFGDIESVGLGIQEMRERGVKISSTTRSLVDSIGSAVRIDQERAELKEKEQGYFSEEEINAWRKMERLVEENQEEVERKRRAADDERWRAREAITKRKYMEEREQAERDRPSLFMRGNSGREDGQVREPWDLTEREERERRDKGW